MRVFFPILFFAAVILILGLLELLFLRVLNRAWWRKRYVRRLAWLLPISGFILVLFWGAGEYFSQNWLSYPASILLALVFVLEAGLMISLPISGLFHGLNHLVDRIIRHRQPETSAEPVDSRRRTFLKGMAAATPVLSLAAGTGGLATAFTPVRVFVLPIFFDNLPLDLEGKRILHVSDVHLRHYVTLDTVEQVVASARSFSPDLILITGDLADDLAQLPGALTLLHELRAPLGAFAALGNHEYFQGVAEVRRLFDASPIPLLVNRGTLIPVGGSRLFVGGIDDPRRMGARDIPFFERAIDTTLRDADSDAFRILMSHRPDGFEIASQRGVHLTLAGHTHGGQIGLFGRSIFESSRPDRYLWGHYQIGASHLYTSSGAGHWFPFRLGCPAEAPVIELRRTVV